ncbi:MAG: DUF2723 domain-containing protein [Deltaproteobacteria bacterium]|nr:DUF2723 domain-containing protein [Deltaproteobacteria bacterium]
MPAANSNKGLPLWPALLVFAATSLITVLFAFPFPDWLDSPEFLYAARRLGLFHPPGSPLALLLAHPLFAWPGEQADTLVLLFSGFCLAGAGGLLTRSLQHLWQALGPKSAWIRDMSALGLGLSLAVSPAFLGQLARAEVYGLACLIFAGGLHQLLRLSLEDPDEQEQVEQEQLTRALRVSALLGMGLAVHGPMVLALLGLMLAMMSKAQFAKLWWPPRRLLRHGLAGLLGAAPLLLLPLMVHGASDLRWGNPRELSGLWSIVSGQTFQASFTAEARAAAAGLPRYLALLAEGSGWGLFLLALPSLYFLGRRRFRLVLGLILALGINASSLLLQKSFRLDNPDVSGYALPAFVLLTILCASGLATIATALQKLRHWMSPMTLVLVLATLVAQAPGLLRADRSSCSAGTSWAKASLEAVPEGGIVLLADFNLVFMLEYLQSVHGLRQDVLILYLRDLDNQALRESLFAEHPELRRVLPDSNGLQARVLDKLAALRPLAMDAGPHLQPELARHGRFRGLLWIHGTSADEEETRPSLWACADGSRDLRSAKVLAWHAIWQSRLAFRLGDFDLAKSRAHLARCAAPKDAQVQKLAHLLDLEPGGDCPKQGGPILSISSQLPPTWISALFTALGLLLWGMACLRLPRISRHGSWVLTFSALIGLGLMAAGIAWV